MKKTLTAILITGIFMTLSQFSTEAKQKVTATPKQLEQIELKTDPNKTEPNKTTTDEKPLKTLYRYEYHSLPFAAVGRLRPFGR